jgi:DNA-binding NtrC family response regulator
MGAYDYIAKPYNFDELVLTINRALEHKDLLVKTTILANQVNRKLSNNIVGNSPELQRIINLAKKQHVRLDIN